MKTPEAQHAGEHRRAEKLAQQHARPTHAKPFEKALLERGSVPERNIQQGIDNQAGADLQSLNDAAHDLGSSDPDADLSCD